MLLQPGVVQFENIRKPVIEERRAIPVRRVENLRPKHPE